MKVAFTNNFNISGNGTATTRNTKGKNLFSWLFGQKNGKEDSKFESFDHDHANAGIEVSGTIELSAEISVEEFSELSKLNKENSLLQREELSWLYSGAKKFVNDLASGIETKGKDIVNACWDVSEEYSQRDHQNTLKNIERNSEREIKREKTFAEEQKAKADLRKKEEKKSDDWAKL